MSPSNSLSTIDCSHDGMLNIDTASSVGQLSATPFATFTRVSKPTTSAVRKVADFGLPIIGPVMASTSSIPNPKVSAKLKMDIMLNTPILLAMKAGVSFAKTVVFPKNTLPKCCKKSTTSGFVNDVGMISNKRRYLGGLKKCVPQKLDLKSSLLPSANICMGIPDVLLVIRVPGLRYFSTSAKIDCFISRRSTTTSMTQSHLFISCRLSVKLPVLIRSAVFFV